MLITYMVQKTIKKKTYPKIIFKKKKQPTLFLTFQKIKVLAQLDFATPLPLTQKNINLEQILFSQLSFWPLHPSCTIPNLPPPLSLYLLDQKTLHNTKYNSATKMHPHFNNGSSKSNFFCHQHNFLMTKVPHTKHISYFLLEGAICIPKANP